MSYRACSPVLLVEGDADKEAVPFLLRRLFGEVGSADCFPSSHPIRCGDVPKVRRAGHLERLVEYACSRPDGDSALLLIDCDDDCPKHLIADFVPRVAPIAERFGKKVGIAFFWREFETLFLYSLRELASARPEYSWSLDADYETRDWSATRGAKGKLNQSMTNYYYKETRDQPRFVNDLDLPVLRTRCRSTDHLFRLLTWLGDEEADTLVYPSV